MTQRTGNIAEWHGLGEIRNDNAAETSPPFGKSQIPASCVPSDPDASQFGTSTAIAVRIEIEVPLMTVPKKDRDGNLVNALALMLEQLGDEYTDSAQGVFDTTDARFERILRSTWAEMEDLGFIRRDDQITGKTTPDYLFTSAGWYTAHDRLGHTQNGSEFVAKLARVSKALKDCIKAENRTETIEDAQTVAQAAQVSYNFLCNAIDSAAIDRCFGQRGATWYGRPGAEIFIPANFGFR